MDTKNIIEKWYKKIGFPAEFDNEFYAALAAYDVPATAKFEDYNLDEEDGKKNFLYFLFLGKDA